jgi:DNA-binding NarL/FixJ family response regulator
MPTWDGVQTAIALRAVRPDLPLIFWSGGAPAALLQRARSLNLHAIFDKPCEAQRIVDAVLAIG